jgi:hypothetical protein
LKEVSTAQSPCSFAAFKSDFVIEGIVGASLSRCVSTVAGNPSRRTIESQEKNAMKVCSEVSLFYFLKFHSRRKLDYLFLHDSHASRPFSHIPTRTDPFAAVSSPLPFATPFSKPPRYDEPSENDKNPLKTI